MSKEEINAFLGAGTVYKGELTFQGAVRIDGEFEGNIRSDGALIVGKDSVVRAGLEVGELVLSGSFTGDAVAKRRVIIHKGGVFTGNLYSPALVVEEGAVLDGALHMRDEKKPAQQAQQAQPYTADAAEDA